MTVLRNIWAAVHLLNPRDRWLLILVTSVLMLTGLLDLAGVLLLGIVSVLSVSVVSGAPMPSQVESVVDRLGWGNSEPITLAAWLTLAAGLVLIGKSVFAMLLTRRTLRFLASRQASLSVQLTERFLSLPLLEVQNRSTQDMAYTLTLGVSAATVGILGAASSAVADVGLLLVLSAGLFVVDPMVTIFAAVYFGVIAFVLHRLLSRWAANLGQTSTTVDIDSYRAVSEAIATYREISVAHRRSAYVDLFERLRWQSAWAGADFQFVGLIPKYVFEVALVIGGILLAISQAATRDVVAAVGIVAVFLVAASRIMPALLRLQGASLLIRQSEASASLVFHLAKYLGGVVASPRNDRRARVRRDFFGARADFQPSIVVSEVSVTYEGNSTPALDRISFSASPGLSIALVGSTGAGKSTLADVILGVINASSGRVEVGGLVPFQAIKRWPGGLAYVPQDVALISGTVRENVAIGLPRDCYSDEEVWAALGDAHLADFLTEYREGLDTVVGERGVRLSGGQRQRLGVARALLTRPKLLVLDEATSALDAETERMISDTMRALHGTVTTVTIAHRLATVRDSDLVLLLEGGRLTASGTFQQVRENSPAFHRQALLLGF